MTSTRASVPRRVSPEQVRAITAPRRLEILEVLQARGPSSAAEIASQLGRRPDRVHYHLNAMAAVGCLRRVRVRSGGRGRPASIWKISSASFTHRLQPDSPASREAWTESAVALLRAAGRDLARAVAAGVVRDGGPRRNARVGRLKAWLNDAEVREVERRLEELQAFFAARAQAGRGRLHVLTLASCPIATP